MDHSTLTLSFPRRACPRPDRGRESTAHEGPGPAVPGFLLGAGMTGSIPKGWENLPTNTNRTQDRSRLSFSLYSPSFPGHNGRRSFGSRPLRERTGGRSARVVSRWICEGDGFDGVILWEEPEKHERLLSQEEGFHADRAAGRHFHRRHSDGDSVAVPGDASERPSACLGLGLDCHCRIAADLL